MRLAIPWNADVTPGASAAAAEHAEERVAVGIVAPEESSATKKVLLAGMEEVSAAAMADSSMGDWARQKAY